MTRKFIEGGYSPQSFAKLLYGSECLMLGFSRGSAARKLHDKTRPQDLSQVPLVNASEDVLDRDHRVEMPFFNRAHNR